MSRFFHADNASRAFDAGGAQVRFQQYGAFAGSMRGVFEANDDREVTRLLMLVFDRSSGVREITEPEYHQYRRAASTGLIAQSLNVTQDIGEGWKNILKDHPTLAEQTQWETGQFTAPSPQATDFNCTIVEVKGQPWLITRRSVRVGFLWDSTLVAYPIQKKNKLGPGIRLELPRTASTEQYEDPRAVVHAGNVYIGYCSWHRGHDSARQHLAIFSPDWKWLASWKVNYGFNKLERDGHEKNWLWFNHDGVWHIVYRFDPHIVCVLKDGGEVSQVYDSRLTTKRWDYGEVRGGTPPVKVGDEYVSFFHSSLPWTNRQRRYFMGAYSFEARPPFRVTAVTSEPILAGTDKETRILGGPLVIFPCGALLQRGKWTVTYGINDEACGWIKIPHDGLMPKAA